MAAVGVVACPSHVAGSLCGWHVHDYERVWNIAVC